MTNLLATRLQNIKPSATLAVAAKAAQLRAQGKKIIDLSTGEPDFDTPEPIKQAAIQAIQEGFTKYTAVDGIPDLKTAISEKFSRENNLNYALDQIIVSSGAKQCIFNAILTLINPGDEVVIPAPYWVSYPDMVKLAGGVPKFIPTDLSNNFKITPKQLQEALSENTKLVIFNSPSNPTGQAYTQDELSSLCKILLSHPKIYLLSDDIYEHLLWSQPFCNPLNVCPGLKERTIVVNGVSKTYAMTGWRIGYAAGPSEVIAGMKKIQSQSTSNPNSIAQKAAMFALKSHKQLDETIKKMVNDFNRRHTFVVEGFMRIPGVKILQSAGTFYSFPNVSEGMKKLGIKDDITLCQILLEQCGLAFVPGTEFGAPGHIRLSFATAFEHLKEMVKAIERFFK